MSIPTSKPGEVTHLKGVIFGPPKTGKTVLACSGEGKTLLVLMEPEGDLSIRDAEHVDVTRPTTYQELADITSFLRSESHDYQTVVFDSVTFMAELIGGRALAEVLRKSGGDPRRVYNQIGTSVNQIVNEAARLPMNVIFITQLKADKTDSDGDPVDPEEGEYPLSLAVTPMVYKVLAPVVSFIARTYKKKGFDSNKKPVVQYWVSFEDYGRSPAGSRIPVPSAVQDLKLEKLLQQAKKGK